MQISVKTTFPDVMRKLDQLSDEVATKVTVRAVNRTVDQAKTQMSRSIRSEFNISLAKVNEKLTVKKASFKGGRFSVVAELLSRTAGGRRRSVNVINFAARPGAKGVTVKIRKAGSRKTITGAFIGNKGRTVFKRTGSKRLPIEPVQTIDVPQMFNTKRINAAVLRAINEKFPTIFERELRFALTQFQAKR